MNRTVRLDKTVCYCVTVFVEALNQGNADSSENDMNSEDEKALDPSAEEDDSEM
jgi:hypothetical protein